MSLSSITTIFMMSSSTIPGASWPPSLPSNKIKEIDEAADEFEQYQLHINKPLEEIYEQPFYSTLCNEFLEKSNYLIQIFEKYGPFIKGGVYKSKESTIMCMFLGYTYNKALPQKEQFLSLRKRKEALNLKKDKQQTFYFITEKWLIHDQVRDHSLSQDTFLKPDWGPNFLFPVCPLAAKKQFKAYCHRKKARHAKIFEAIEKVKQKQYDSYSFSSGRK